MNASGKEPYRNKRVAPRTPKRPARKARDRGVVPLLRRERAAAGRDAAAAECNGCFCTATNPPRTRLLIATNNRGKVRELARMLEGLPVELVLPADVGVALEVEETGTTFEANAELKARAFAEASGLPTLADDSGLVVDALDGRPGVHSARFAGTPRSDRRNLERLLGELRDVPDERRTARFRCVAALAVPAAGPAFAGVMPGGAAFFRGTCEGRIVREPSGTDGFGYDPVFVAQGLDATFAELPAEEKDARSHRGRAIEAFRRRLVEALGTGPGDSC